MGDCHTVVSPQMCYKEAMLLTVHLCLCVSFLCRPKSLEQGQCSPGWCFQIGLLMTTIIASLFSSVDTRAILRAVNLWIVCEFRVLDFWTLSYRNIAGNFSYSFLKTVISPEVRCRTNLRRYRNEIFLNSILMNVIVYVYLSIRFCT